MFCWLTKQVDQENKMGGLSFSLWSGPWIFLSRIETLCLCLFLSMKLKRKEDVRRQMAHCGPEWEGYHVDH